jgi:hypothetical protein
MSGFLPGTTIELKATIPNAAKDLMDSIFLSGGLVLSQVTKMTGLAPYEVQNWVKRGFLPPPVHKKYDRNQFCRLAMINMLRESMQIDTITQLLSFINGSLSDASDDLVDDSELYNYYVNLTAMMGNHLPDEFRGEFFAGGDRLHLRGDLSRLCRFSLCHLHFLRLGGSF